MALTDRSLAHDEPYIEDTCEQLFLLEILVDKIDVKTEGLLGSVEKKEEPIIEEEEEEEEEELDEDDEEAKKKREEERRRKKKKKRITRPIKVKVKFFDFPMIEIDEWDFTEVKEERAMQMDMLKEEVLDSEEEELRADEEDMTVEEWREARAKKRLELAEELAGSMPPGDKFCSGKSCLFPMIPLDLVNLIKKTPLRVQVNRAGDSEQAARVIGQTTITLGENFIEAIQLASTPTVLPVSAFIDGPYQLKNVFGEVTATVYLYIRISCFGNSIFTQFKLKDGDEGYLFKMSGSNKLEADRLLERIRRGKDQDLPKLVPLFTKAEDFNVGARAPSINEIETELKPPINWHRKGDNPLIINICSPEKLCQKVFTKPNYRRKPTVEQEMLEEVIPGFGRQLGDPKFIYKNPTIPRKMDLIEVEKKVASLGSILFPIKKTLPSFSSKDLNEPGSKLACQFGTGWSPVKFPLPRWDPYPPISSLNLDKEPYLNSDIYPYKLPSIKTAHDLAIAARIICKKSYLSERNCTCTELAEGLKRKSSSIHCDCINVMSEMAVSKNQSNYVGSSSLEMGRNKIDENVDEENKNIQIVLMFQVEYNNEIEYKTEIKKRNNTINKIRRKMKSEKILFSRRHYFSKSKILNEQDEAIDAEGQKTRTICGVKSRIYDADKDIDGKIKISKSKEVQQKSEKSVDDTEQIVKILHRCTCTDDKECAQELKNKYNLSKYFKKSKSKDCKEKFIDIIINNEIFNKAENDAKKIFQSINQNKKLRDEELELERIKKELEAEQLVGKIKRQEAVNLIKEDVEQQLNKDEIVDQVRSDEMSIPKTIQVTEMEDGVTYLNQDDIVNNFEEKFIEEKLDEKSKAGIVVAPSSNASNIASNDNHIIRNINLLKDIALKAKKPKEKPIYGNYIHTEGYYPGMKVGHDDCHFDKNTEKYAAWKWDSEVKKKPKKRTIEEELANEDIKGSESKTADADGEIDDDDDDDAKKEKQTKKKKHRRRKNDAKIERGSETCIGSFTTVTKGTCNNIKVDKERDKRLALEGRYVHTEGFYPGLQVGHNKCKFDKKSPKYMAWRWDYPTDEMNKLTRQAEMKEKGKERGGDIHKKKGKHAVSAPLRYKPKNPLIFENYKKLINGEVKMEPTLQFKKQNGKYYIKLCPTEDPLTKTRPDNVERKDIILFEVNPKHPDGTECSSDDQSSSTDTSTVSNDSLAVDFLCPLGVSKLIPPMMKLSRGIQVCENGEHKPSSEHIGSEIEIII